MPNVLVVGGGLSGVATAWFLQQAVVSVSNKLKDELRVQVFEANERLGGRMATHPFLNENLKELRGHADLGAQYITRYRNPDHDEVFSVLSQRGILQPFDTASGAIDGIKTSSETYPHLLAPLGAQSIVESLSEGLAVSLSTKVQSISLFSDRISVSSVSREGEQCSDWDYVILALPTSHALQILSNSPSLSSLPSTSAYNTLISTLSSVRYSARYAYAALFPRLEGTEQTSTWTAKYLPSDPILRYLSIENHKYWAVSGPEQERFVSVIVHTAIPYYEERERLRRERADEERVDEETKLELLESMRRHLPFSPPLSDPLQQHLCRWTVSQTLKPLGTSSLHHLALPLGDQRALFFAGDYFTSSNMEGALDSARSVSNSLLSQMLQQ